MKSFKKNITLAVVILSTLTLGACTTLTSVNPEQRSFYDNTQQNLKQESTSIITDSCLIRSEIGTSHVLYQQSEIVAKGVSNKLETVLNKQGVNVKSNIQPLICGILNEKSLKHYDIKYKHDGQREELTSYPVISSHAQYSEKSNQAFHELFVAIKKAKNPSRKVLSTSLELDQKSLTQIKSAVDTDKVFVLLVQGTHTSTARKMAVGLTSVVLTQGDYVMEQQDRQSYSVYLVNLKTNKLEWVKEKRALKGQLFKMPVSETYTIDNMLDPLYVE